MSEWRSNLKRSVVSFDFKLHLSKSMLEFLCAVADDVSWDRHWSSYIHVPDNFLATSASLERRGLVERKAKKGEGMGIAGGSSFWKLTPAGEHVVELIKMAGVFQEAVDAQVKQIKKQATA